MAGIDIPLVSLKTVLHPPTVLDIAYMGEEPFFLAMQYLCLDKKMLIQDETLQSSLSNFQVLMKVLEQSQDKEKKNAIIMLLRILFPGSSPAITKNSILLVQKDGESILIDDENFDDFQVLLRQVLCASHLFQGGNVQYNPTKGRAEEIAKKLMKGRQKIAELKSKGKSESVLTRYLSILQVGLHISQEECNKKTLFQIFDLMDRFEAFVSWDTDFRVRLAGGSPDQQVESWMRDLHPQ